MLTLEDVGGSNFLLLVLSIVHVLQVLCAATFHTRNYKLIVITMGRSRRQFIRVSLTPPRSSV